MDLISCTDATFSYEGNVAVQNLNFTIQSGDYLCIVGENGSGKSTLIRGLLRLKTPSGGKVTVAPSLKPNEVGYLPQQTQAQRDFPSSVYETVLSGRLSARGLLPFYTKGDKKIVLENLERLKIYDLKDKCYRELSGGQQQRVLLCRALCATKKALLLDEPVTGLDPKVTIELYETIQEINKTMGITIIMVSHDIKSIMDYATHILHLKNKQLFFGAKADYENSKVGKMFLGGDDVV
ncbi:ABC transporter ATP-binding protein [Clostridia bacterium]|nr:ABC transporter ATP-binding protein [Clostridia bacterium]